MGTDQRCRAGKRVCACAFRMCGNLVDVNILRSREAVILLRKVTIVAITVFVSDEFFQVYISGVAIMLFLVAHVVVRPFARPLKPTSAAMSAKKVNVSHAWLRSQWVYLCLCHLLVRFSFLLCCITLLMPHLDSGAAFRIHQPPHERNCVC